VRRLMGAALLALMAVGMVLGQKAPKRVPSQVQVARQFLLALLRADYRKAYEKLSPDARRSMSSAQFRVAAKPLYAQGKRRGADIELYKLGFRLLENDRTEGFVAFSFAADSLLKHPSEWLEVTFRDTASRQVLGFGLRKAGK